MAYGNTPGNPDLPVPPGVPGGGVVIDIEEEKRLATIKVNSEGVLMNSIGLKANRVAMVGLGEFLPPIPQNRTEPLVLTLCPNPGGLQWGDCLTYKVGEVGPAGGWVFSVSEGGLHGLEAAPVDLPQAEWGCYDVNITGAGSSAVGDGQKNTTAILEAGCVGEYTYSTEIAARLADSYELKGFNDWYLPSEDEIGLMYTNLEVNGLGNFVTYGSYRSSTDGGSRIFSREKSFSTGQNFGLGRNSESNVRPVRSF